MPGLDGVSAAREITRDAPGVAVLMLTMFDDEESVFAAMRAGARGYVLKGATQEEIVRAIRAVAAGERYSDPASPDGCSVGCPAQRSRPTPFRSSLRVNGRSSSYLRQGCHASAIFAKLQVADRTEAVLRARDAGFGGSPRSSA